MTWTIIRSLPTFQIGTARDFQIIRAAGGPRGLPAGQDIGWIISTALADGEILAAPPLPHPATYVAIYAHSESGFSTSQVLTVRLKRAGSVIGTATLAVGPGAQDWQASISELAGEVADVPVLVLPNPADSQCTDLSVSLGSTP